MPRLVKKNAHAPYILKPQKQDTALCMCGLSKNQPFCDGSHLKTQDEDDKKMYQYDKYGNREIIDNCCRCCNENDNKCCKEE